MQDIIGFTAEQSELKCLITDLLDEDQICTGVGLNTDSTDDMLDVVIGCDQKYPVCPNCRWTNRKTVSNRDGKHRSTKKDVFLKNGQNTRLTLIRYRRKCDCGKVFYTNIPKKLQPGEQAKKAAYRAIEDSTLVLTQNSVGVPFSKAEGSDVLNTLLKAIWDIASGNREPQNEYERNAAEKFQKISYFKECGTLFFIPFTFSSQERCCVCGWNGMTAYLLDILEEYSAEAIHECVSKHVKRKENVRAVYCGVNDDVVYVLQNLLSNANIVYSRKCMHDYICDCCTDSGDANLSSKSSLRKRILNIVKRATHEEYLTVFDHWGSALKTELQKSSQKIHDLFYLDEYREITGNSFKTPYDSSSFSSLLGWIKENGNSSFMVMKTRMLLNPEMRANGFVTKLVVVTSQTQNIEDFGVDINDLMKMQEQYHQLIADTCGIQFKKSKWPEELKAIAESCGE